MSNKKFKIKKSILTIIITICLTIKSINSIFLSIQGNYVECIYKDSTSEKGLIGKYFMAGENETNNLVFIKDLNNNMIWSNRGQKQSEFRISVEKDQTYQICFENLDKKYLTVTFDFYDDEKLNNIVSTQSITDMNQNVHEMRKKVDIIHHDIRNSAVRRKVHMDSKLLLNFT